MKQHQKGIFNPSSDDKFDNAIFEIAGTDKNPVPKPPMMPRKYLHDINIIGCLCLYEEEREIYTERVKERESEIQLQARRDRYRHGETETNTERQRQKNTNIVKETERGRHNEIERQR